MAFHSIISPLPQEHVMDQIQNHVVAIQFFSKTTVVPYLPLLVASLAKLGLPNHLTHTVVHRRVILTKG